MTVRSRRCTSHGSACSALLAATAGHPVTLMGEWDGVARVARTFPKAPFAAEARAPAKEALPAALDELVDFGRPRRVWLAVLVDRGGHELPIAADFVGARLEVADGQDVQVRLREDGQGEDVVRVTGRAP